MMTQAFHAQWAWRGGEEAIANVRITVSNGVISNVEDGVDAQASDVCIAGVVMPGLVNAHSHAFHRALRGRTHGGSGDFWSWRTPMDVVKFANTSDATERHLGKCHCCEFAICFWC